MDGDRARRDGEDNRPTSRRELLGWYSYGLAAEVFTVCGVGSFLPMTLEQLAREVGVLHADKTTPCTGSTQTPRHSSQPSLTARDENQCIVDLFGYELNTSSFTLYSFSLAIVVQTLVLISIGAISDYGSNRKILLLALGFTGSTACMLFILVDPSIFLAGLSLTIVSVASLGSSFVLLNSFLPLLVANHPPTTSDKSGFEPVPLDEIPTMTEDEASLDDLDPLHESSETNGLFTGVPRPEMPMISDQSSSAIKLSNSISSRAIGVGYTASVLVQCIGITIIALFSKSKATGAQFPATMPLRTVLLFIGSVWASFTIPTAFWLRRRPGPPLPWNVDKTKPRTNSILSGFRYVVFAWVSLGRTIKVAFRLREVVKFLLGWFLLSDGVATITGTAILFAKVELKLAPAAVALLSITATVAGIIGAFCWPKIARYFGLSSISVVLCCIFLFEIIPLYGLLGFIPFIKGLGVIGMQQWWEIYPFGFLLGFIMGGISSYCRSIFGTLIPPGMEAAFYALFSVTDKGSSVIGPAVVGRIIDVTGSIRMGFWFLAFLMISPAPFFWFVDADKGRAEGLMMARRRIALHSAEEDTQDVQH